MAGGGQDWTGTLRRGAASLALVYALLCCAVLLFHRRLIYPAPRRVERPPPGPGELVEIPRAGGSAVVGLWIAPPVDEAATIVYFHGNAEQLSWQADLGQAFAHRGLGFLALEYPGYGLMQDQRPSERALYGAAQAGLDWLRAQGVPAARTVLMGRSLGSGPATELAARGHAARLVLVAPFTSLPDMARTVVPFLPMGLLVRDRFDNAAKAPDIPIPVLVVHGERDEVIPFRMGEQLASLFPDARLERLPGVGHNDLPLHPGTPLVATIAAFARAD